MEFNLSVPFQTDREAEIAYNALRVDSEPVRSKVSKKLSVQGNCLHATFTAEEPKNLRVSVTGFFTHLILVSETMLQFGPPRK